MRPTIPLLQRYRSVRPLTAAGDLPPGTPEGCRTMLPEMTSVRIEEHPDSRPRTTTGEPVAELPRCR
jgi:hypothetical protein